MANSTLKASKLIFEAFRDSKIPLSEKEISEKTTLSREQSKRGIKDLLNFGAIVCTHEQFDPETGRPIYFYQFVKARK